MAQDFAKKKPVRRANGARRTNHKTKPNENKRWKWLLGGAISGTLITAALYFSVPGLSRDHASAVDADSRERSPENEPETHKNRYAFYNLLPQSEVTLPESNRADIEANPPRGKVEASAKADSYLLQAGSFRSAADADRRRAELLLLGFNARIETVRVDGRETWHRVQVGPFASYSQLSGARERLAAEQIESLLIRKRT